MVSVEVLWPECAIWTGIREVAYVRFPLGLLSGPCDASRSPSGHSWSVTGPFSRPRAVDCACSADLPPLPPGLRDSPPASIRLPSEPSARLPRTPPWSLDAPFSDLSVLSCWRSEEHTSELQSPCNL